MQPGAPAFPRSGQGMQGLDREALERCARPGDEGGRMDANAAAGSAAVPGEAGRADVTSYDIARIMQAIPHRYPFLLVDRVVELRPDHSCIGIKNVSINEPFFQGHFPTHPVFPGVLIIESMAQTGAVLVVETLGESANGKLVYFMTIENAKFRKPVVPGDQMRIHVVKEKRRGAIWKFRAEAMVDGKLVAEATCSAMILDK
jgi:3-hydroxyacyl-[acyl-carrier-protein] dehydratase